MDTVHYILLTYIIFMLIAYASFGLLIGSFLTMCIYRIPYGREKGPPRWDEEDSGQEEENTGDDNETIETAQISFCHPKRSICPTCQKQLFWWHNIPLFSWILLKGKCAFCKAPISFRYPLVEVLTAVISALSFGQYGLTFTGVVVFAFCAALLAISFIDIDYYIIPDVISLPGILLGIIFAVINQFTNIFTWPIALDVWSSLFGVLFGGGFLLLVSEVYFRIRKRIGLGMGDVKLLAMTGAFFGVEGAFYTMIIGSLMGSVGGLLLLLLVGKKMSHPLPFGPYLAIGTILYLFGLPDGPHWRGLFF